jgi:hypothetical protein
MTGCGGCAFGLQPIKAMHSDRMVRLRKLVSHHRLAIAYIVLAVLGLVVDKHCNLVARCTCKQ